MFSEFLCVSVVRCVLLVLPVVGMAHGAAVEVTGRVVDEETGEGVGAAVVRAVGVTQRAVTEADGTFRLAGLAPGRHRFEVGAGTHHPRTLRIEVAPDGKPIVIRLKRSEGAIEGGSVEVVAPRERTVRETGVSVETVTREEIKQVSGAFEDPVKTLLMFPGVASVTDFGGALFVRGGNAFENLSLWDGIVIENPYHLVLFGGGFNSVFNPDMVRDMQLHKGAFPAEFGDKVSGILALSSRRATGERPKGAVSLGIIDSKASLEADLGGRVNVIVGARRSYYDLAYRMLTSDRNIVLPTFWDAQARIEIELGRLGSLQIDFMHYDDSFRFTGRDDESGEERTFRWAAPGTVTGLIWKVVARPGLLATTTVSINDFRIEGRFSATNPVSLEYAEQLYQVGQRFVWHAAGNHEWTAGWNVFPRKIRFAFLLPVWSGENGPPDGNRRLFDATVPTYFKAHAFFEDRWFVNPWLTISSGLRADYHRVLKKGYLDPRVAASIGLRPGTIGRVAWGIIHQSPDEGLSPGLRIADLMYARSIHSVASIEHELTARTRLTAETFYKDLSDLMQPPFSGRTGGLDAVTLTRGRGYAYGAEFVLRQELSGGFWGWASYGYSVSRRKDDPSLPWYATESDLTHQGSLVLNWRWRTFLLHGRVRYATGKPFTPVIRSQGGPTVWIASYGELNSERFPHYRRFDLRAEKEWKWRLATMRLYIEVLNVENRRNVWNVFYSEDFSQKFDVGQMPRLPTVGLELEF